MEGIGRPRVEPSFNPHVVDHMIKVPDAATFAALRFLKEVSGRSCGGSTGTNLYGALQLMAEMLHSNQAGSVVSMICDPGDRYLETYYNDSWLAEKGYEIGPYFAQMKSFFESGQWQNIR